MTARASSSKGSDGWLAGVDWLVDAGWLVCARIVAGWAGPGFLKALGLAFGSVLALAGLAAGIARELADVPPTWDGQELLLEVEVRLPVTVVAAPDAGGESHLELGSVSGGVQRSRSIGELRVAEARQQDGRWIVPGSVVIHTGRGARSLGLRVGGGHILIMVDASASMLDETVVNVLRMRNMSEARKLLSEKWRRTLSTVDWLAAQLPLESEFQIYAFNTQTWPLKEGSDGKWLKVNDPNALNEALSALRKTIPKDGTSLENAFGAIATLNPKPDNVILITDGLPTQAASAPLIKKTVDGDDRLKFFERAVAKYPKNVPLNVILMPMEGDPSAPSAFWLASRRTGGSFISPSKDWP